MRWAVSSNLICAVVRIATSRLRRDGKGCLGFSTTGLSGLLVLLALPIGCGGGGDSLLVFAASSLTDPLRQLAAIYEERTGVEVDISFGASGRLAQQISRGAPADVLISAGEQPIDRLVDEGLVDTSSRRALLTNRLVLVTKHGDDRAISSLEVLLDADGMLAIADPELAPAGGYAREALRHLGLWEALEPRLVYGGNVRTTLGYVESGNVAAALVYRTDATVSDRVSVAEILPADAHSLIVYPAVVVGTSDKREQAAGFIEFLGGEEASQVFRDMGFEISGAATQGVEN